MQTGWINDNGKDYCLYSSGTMIHDCDMYGYRFDSNGEATKLS
jgi:glucan-binding YG repeat protein